MPYSQQLWLANEIGAHQWALILAGGEGSRLRTLTTTASGIAVPKQFCSLGGGPSLLYDALQRARVVAPPERTCVVVAKHQELWWRPLSESIPPDNVIVQPGGRGTGAGILLPLLQILKRDPDATLLVLPSDHYVRNEGVLARSLQRSVAEVVREGGIILLGLAPDEADPELGYIVPRSGPSDAVQGVEKFVEKPSAAVARALIDRGALWNCFIFAASGRALLSAFEAQCPDVVAAMRSLVLAPDDQGLAQQRLSALYAELPTLDFSRDIIEPRASALKVLKVPACGWSDLGTPRRVAQVIAKDRSTLRHQAWIPSHALGFLDLSAHPQARAG